MDSFGDFLLETRRAKGLAQEEIAERVGVSRQTVSKWETNRSVPTYDKLTLLAKELDLDLGTLLGFESAQSGLAYAQSSGERGEAFAPHSASAVEEYGSMLKEGGKFFTSATLATIGVLYAALIVVITCAAFGVTGANGGVMDDTTLCILFLIVLICTCVGFGSLTLWIIAATGSSAQTRRERAAKKKQSDVEDSKRNDRQEDQNVNRK